MNVQKIFSRGTEINKIAFSDIEDYLTEAGINADKAFEEMADEKEFVYISNGFVRGLRKETEPGEWHHYFKKDAGSFDAFKMQF